MWLLSVIHKQVIVIWFLHYNMNMLLTKKKRHLNLMIIPLLYYVTLGSILCGINYLIHASACLCKLIYTLQWLYIFNSLRSVDAYILQQNGLSLVQTMAWCQENANLWSVIPLNKPDWNFNQNTNSLLQDYWFKMSK